jgi:hypothetical protein
MRRMAAWSSVALKSPVSSRTWPSGVAAGWAARSARQQRTWRSAYGEQLCTDSTSTGEAPATRTVAYACRIPLGLRRTPAEASGKRLNTPDPAEPYAGPALRWANSERSPSRSSASSVSGDSSCTASTSTRRSRTSASTASGDPPTSSRLTESTRTTGPPPTSRPTPPPSATQRGSTHVSSAADASPAAAAGHHRRSPSAIPAGTGDQAAAYGVNASNCTSGPTSTPPSRTAAHASPGAASAQHNTVTARTLAASGRRRRVGRKTFTTR